jgi:hypothetical protein
MGLAVVDRVTAKLESTGELALPDDTRTGCRDSQIEYTVVPVPVRRYIEDRASANPGAPTIDPDTEPSTEPNTIPVPSPDPAPDQLPGIVPLPDADPVPDQCPIFP